MRKSRLGLVLGVGGIATALPLACGGDDGPEEDPYADLVTIEEGRLVGELAEATCYGIGECCNARSYSYDDEACEVNTRAFWSRHFPRSSGIIDYDPEVAAECVRESYARAARCDYPDSEIEPCNRVYLGTRALGEACQRREECAPSGLGEPECASSGAGMVCVGAMRGSVGDRCQETCTDDGFMWGCSGGGAVPDENTWTRCFTNDGLYCAGDLDPVCAPLVEIGDECDSGGSDGAARCVEGAVCDPTTGVCVAKLSVGEGCSPAVLSECIEGAYCSIATDACEERQPDGVPCGNFEQDCIGFCDTASDTCTGAFAVGVMSATVCSGSVMPRI